MNNAWPRHRGDKSVVLTSQSSVTADQRYDVSAEDLAKLADKLIQLLRIRTLAIGLKLFDDADEMQSVPGIRTPADGVKFTTCQLVTQVRTAGFTLGIRTGNLRNGNCGGVIGLNPTDSRTLSGEAMDGVWFENRESAREHQELMTRVEPRYMGLCGSPLRSRRLDPPDIVLFYATPAQTILFVNGLQWKRYKRYDMTITGESACSDSWGRALATRNTSISIPCYAERRYGGVAEDELLLAMPPDEFARGIEGLEGLSKVGLRYPIPPYGSQSDPSAGMSISYPGKS